MKIWKYKLPPRRGQFTLELPIGWQILSIQTQNDVPVMWCAVNDKASTELVRFEILFTGDEYVPNFSILYLTTFQIGWTVYHLFRL